ncbi:MAG: tetratricopeptide repeat protein [Terracidiphilus sp.]
MKRSIAAAKRILLMAMVGVWAAGCVAAWSQYSKPSTEPEYRRAPSMFASLTEAPQFLVIDRPLKGTLYPPEITAPQFAWRDGNTGSKVWRIEIEFSGHGHPLRIWSNGEKMLVGELDTQLQGYVEPTLTAEEQMMHTWRPDEKTWAEIKSRSAEGPATVTISGFASREDSKPLSSARSTFQTSKDVVGAPVFYRDVPLIPPPPETEQRGVIKPLPDSVLPKIRWELRYINETRNRLVMTNLPTCGNCHSFSRDAKVMGIDVDGPANDKGLYALLPLKKVSSISNEYLIHWSAFSEAGAQKRYGFMSQVSPDGKYVVNSIDVPHAHGVRVLDRLYNGFYADYGFGQVFYQTRGVLAWYSKETNKLQPLPGADDPNYVQTAAFWSPDGKYLVFSRAAARDPYPPGAQRATYANDPNETQIQYDLYRIPFNDGKGGTPERIVGASENGMSNNFPKVSPDGKWIVFVRCKNGLLMRPDSKLYIVPFDGGEARPLESNLPVMNSWHSWSPNGKWLVFSSKSPSLYTHLYLTHIDEQGHASPPVVIENVTAANRAVNIPEFLNLGTGELDRIETPAIDFYREFDAAEQLQEEHKYAEAIPAWQIAAAKDPTDARPLNNIGVALDASGRTTEAIEAYQKSLTINPDSSQAQNNLSSALAESGRLEEALEHIRRALELDDSNASAHVNLGHILLQMGGHGDEAVSELKKGIELAPRSPDGYNVYGVYLAHQGRLEEAIAQMQKAVELSPRSAELRYNLGRALAAAGRYPEALPHFEAAAEFTARKDPGTLQMLAAMQFETGEPRRAIATAQEALRLATDQNDSQLTEKLHKDLERYQAQTGVLP